MTTPEHPDDDVRDALADALLDMATRRSPFLARTRFAAKEIGIELETIPKSWRSPVGPWLIILGALHDRTLAELDDDLASPENPVRDRLLEILMTRLDVINQHRDGYRAFLMATPLMPGAPVVSMCDLDSAMSDYLEAAGLGNKGCKGQLHRKALTVIWLDAVRIWLTDDSEESERTMKHLHERLDQADQFIQTFPFLSGKIDKPVTD